MTKQYFIGIDISKQNLDVFIHPDDIHCQYSNTPSGRKKLLTDIEKFVPLGLIVFEASGGYERALRQTLAQNGLPCACVQPTRVHNFIKAHGYKAKTDRLDAKALALFAASGIANPSIAQDETLLELRDFMRALGMIRAHQTQLKCQIEKIGKNKHLQALLKSCERQENNLLKAIKEFVQQHEGLKQIIDLLSSMPGIAFYSACVIISEIPELGACSKNQIAALSGTAPYVRQSGKWAGKASIKGGRHYARKTLYMAALTASRFNDRFKNIYQKLRARGKPFKVAIVAIMRKMIIALNSMVKYNSAWNEIYS